MFTLMFWVVSGRQMHSVKCMKLTRYNIYLYLPDTACELRITLMELWLTSIDLHFYIFMAIVIGLARNKNNKAFNNGLSL